MCDIVDYCTQLSYNIFSRRNADGYIDTEDYMINTGEQQGGVEARASIPVHVIACRVLQDILEPLLPDDLAESVTFQDYGLHRAPNRMTQALQDRIDAVDKASLIILGYGLCGNGVQGLRSRHHILLIPRADDCIALLLGSREAYRREFSAVPGTYYLSKGWLESGSHPLSEYEEYLETYGPDEAAWIMDQQYQHYERVALVAHSQADLERYAPAAREVAHFCERWDMRYEEILGSVGYVLRLMEAAVTLREADVKAEGQISRDFVVVPPGSEVRARAFLGGD